MRKLCHPNLARNRKFLSERQVPKVGTVRCAVRAAYSGATWAKGRPELSLVGASPAFVPPAGRGRGHRSAMSLPYFISIPAGCFILGNAAMTA